MVSNCGCVGDGHRRYAPQDPGKVESIFGMDIDAQAVPTFNHNKNGSNKSTGVHICILKYRDNRGQKRQARVEETQG